MSRKIMVGGFVKGSPTTNFKRCIMKFEEIKNRTNKTLKSGMKIIGDSLLNDNGDVLCECEKHGEFIRNYKMLIRGYGCTMCSKTRNLTSDEFIGKAREVHGDKYDYSKVEYVNNKTVVCIICQKHGEFWQTPNMHLIGRECPECKGGVKYTQDTFITKVQPFLKGNLDLSEFVYVNNQTKSKCKCLDCGNEWYVKPMLLMAGHGCPVCSRKQRGYKRRKTLERFIDDYEKKFPTSSYDFSEAEYKTAFTPIKVKCLQHGFFYSKPNQLLNGNGCPRCVASKMEIALSDRLYEASLPIEIKERNFIPWLINPETNHQMTLDLYIEKLRVAVECQGGQHFESIPFFGGDEALASVQSHDAMKKKLCKENGVELIYLLEEKYNSFMKEDDIFFNKAEDVVKYIKSKFAL